MGACDMAVLNAVSLLLKCCAVVNMYENEGCTSLFYTSDAGHDSWAVACRMRRYELDSKWRSELSNEHTDVVHALMFAGADVTLQRLWVFSSHHMASQEGHIDGVKLLIEHGA